MERKEDRGRDLACLKSEVYEGVEAVLLPCTVPQDVSRDSTAAVWDRKDLSNPTVHLRLQSGDELTKQNSVYRNRTWMRADALQTGDLSLTLRKPRVNDSGSYTCTIRKFGQDQSKTHLQLNVAERPPPPPAPPPLWPKVLSAVLVPVVLLAVGFGVYMYFRYKKLKNKEVLKAEAGVGETSVKLPCRSALRHLPEDTKVEWKDRNGRRVHLYRGGSDRPEEQHRRYRNRTEVNEDLLRTGDLSLTLKYPTNTDRDTYTCTVHSGEGDCLMEKQVELKITECRVEAKEGAESVRLPFRTTQSLPKDSEVEWKRYEPDYMKVHVYYQGLNWPDRQDQEFKGRTEMAEDPLSPGDLSLTLKHPTKADSGRYGCEVNSKEAWRYNRVFLTVTGNDESQTGDGRRGNRSMESDPLMAEQSV